MNSKTLEIGSWHFERMFTPHNMSYVTCHMSRVTCHVSCVACHVSNVICHFSHIYFFQTKWWSLSVEGLLSTGPTPSSSKATKLVNLFRSSSPQEDRRHKWLWSNLGFSEDKARVKKSFIHIFGLENFHNWLAKKANSFECPAQALCIYRVSQSALRRVAVFHAVKN